MAGVVLEMESICEWGQRSSKVFQEGFVEGGVLQNLLVRHVLLCKCN